MASAPGEKAAHKRLNPTAANVPHLSLVAAVTAAAAAVSWTSFSFLLLATTWILVKDGAEGAFRADDLCDKQLRWLPVLKIDKKINFLFAKAVDHVLVMNLKDWIECSLQLNWILNFPFHLNSELSLSLGGGCCGFAWGDLRSAGNPIALRDPAPMHFLGGDVPPSNIHPWHHPEPRQLSAEDAHGVTAPTQFTCFIDEFNKGEWWWQYKVTIRTVSYFYIVKTHSRSREPDWFKCWRHTVDLFWTDLHQTAKTKDLS